MCLVGHENRVGLEVAGIETRAGMGREIAGELKIKGVPFPCRASPAPGTFIVSTFTTDSHEEIWGIVWAPEKITPPFIPSQKARKSVGGGGFSRFYSASATKFCEVGTGVNSERQWYSNCLGVIISECCIEPQIEQALDFNYITSFLSSDRHCCTDIYDLL